MKKFEWDRVMNLGGIRRVEEFFITQSLVDEIEYCRLEGRDVFIGNKDGGTVIKPYGVRYAQLKSFRIIVNTGS